MANITVDASKLEKLAEGLSDYPQQMYAAMASALNRTLTFVGAETKRQVQAEYAVTKSINKSVKMTKATKRNLTAIATYTDKPIPMFVFKNTYKRNRFRSPVTVTIKKSNGARTHNGSNPALFRGYGKKIMRREGGEENIRTAYTLSIPQMVSSDEVYKVIADKAEEYLYKRMEHEVEYRLSKLQQG